MKKRILSVTLVFSLFILTSCVKKALENTLNSVECTTMIGELILSESEDRPCSAIIADIEEIERDCGDFIDDDLRASFATARENCSGN